MASEKYNAKKAILNALMDGRHLSQMDSREFKVTDMRTPIAQLKPDYQGTYELKTKWITTPVRGARIKEYWLEQRPR